MRLSRWDANELVRKWCLQLNIPVSSTSFTIKDDGLHIYTDRPGLWIGKGGETIQRFSEELKVLCNTIHAGEKYSQIVLEEVCPVLTEEQEDDYFHARCEILGL